MALRVGGSRLSIETDLKRILMDAVSKVLGQSTFTEWLESEDELEEGHIGINNSFIFREDLKTRKNAKFLCVSLKKGEQPFGEARAWRPISSSTRNSRTYRKRIRTRLTRK
jgi:hypothetical protein